MARLIAGLYEIEKEIGAGGGGVVYLGRHVRLNKSIVLKADKRSLKAEPEKLRREVDLLKGLSHTYIPQVYDFVEEDGVVYTIMDYIDGESLDKLIGRKLLPAQPHVIKWACQLLEALQYLHSQPPYGILHGDIKPANIMIRPNGDICLIDYNIALALGENGAVKVGFSIGYASPEHYGADYISEHKAAAGGLYSKSVSVNKTQKDFDITEVDSETKVDSETEVDTKTAVDLDETIAGTLNKVRFPLSDRVPLSSSNTSNGKKTLLLDVRSDIYSLGATLYHLLSGNRPAKEAKEVQPLGPEYCSPAISAILSKAMAPLPENRYQTAEEMLKDFLELYQKDKRVIRRKRHICGAAVGLTTLFLAGIGLSFVGLKQLQQHESALALAEYSANKLAEGNKSEAIQLALQAIPEKNIFSGPVTAEAQKALTDALGIYDLSDTFQVFDALELPSAPFDIILSPEGTRFAVLYAYEAAIYETDNLRQIAVLKTQVSAYSDLVFLDENQIIYAGDNGVTAYDTDTDEILWTGETATILSLSGDAARIAAVNRDAEQYCIYDTLSGQLLCKGDFAGGYLRMPVNDIFADAEDYIFALNHDGTMLGVSLAGGGLQLFAWENPENDIIIFEESEYFHFEGGFCGDLFVFSAGDANGTMLGIVDCNEAVYIGGYESPDPIFVKVKKGELYVADSNILERMDGVTFEEEEIAYTDDKIITAFDVDGEYSIIAMEDGSFAFYDAGGNCTLGGTNTRIFDFVRILGGYAVVGNRDEPSLRILKLENHKDAELLQYDARYTHDEIRISEDGQNAMLFDINGFRIYSMDGEIAAEGTFPEPTHIYDQQFRRDGTSSYLEVIWYDGTVRQYDSSDGKVIHEEKIEAPDTDLYEEFYTEKYHFTSALHGAPEVYDIDSGRKVATLEEDAYLTYVTEIDGYYVTEYVSASGERYGYLMNEKFEKLAVLPQLCDIWKGQLVFDYPSGHLRKSSIYSLSELIALGEMNR